MDVATTCKASALPLNHQPALLTHDFDLLFRATARQVVQNESTQPPKEMGHRGDEST